MIVQGYSNYGEPIFLNPDLWNSVLKYYSPSLCLEKYKVPRYHNMRMIEDSPLFDLLEDEDKCTIDMLKTDPVFDLKNYVFKKGNSLFFDPACNIPRHSGSEVYKRTIKVEKADGVVLPRPKTLERYKYGAVFKDTKHIIVIMDYHIMCVRPKIGDTLKEVFIKNKPYIHSKVYTNYESAHENATCIYLGSLIFYPDVDEFIFKVIDGSYKKVIFEDELMNAISITGSKFDYDTVQHLMMMLRSTDAESRHLALRTLTAMDYVHYPSVTKYLLWSNNNSWRDLNLSSSVTFMMTNIGYSFYDNPFMNVLPEEFELARMVYIDYLKDRTAELIKNQRTNLKLTHNIEIDMSLTNNTDNEV